jgi:hypothetical protein
MQIPNGLGYHGKHDDAGKYPCYSFRETAPHIYVDQEPFKGFVKIFGYKS